MHFIYPTYYNENGVNDNKRIKIHGTDNSSSMDKIYPATTRKKHNEM